MRQAERIHIDISVPLQRGMPVWPDSTGFALSQTMRLENGDPANVSRLETDVHCGTHIDAPLHFLQSGEPVDRLPMEVLIGPAFVAHAQGATDITPEVLSALDLPMDIDRLLIRTTNSDLWARGPGSFTSNYVALTRAAAEWVAERGIRLIGIDYLSVQKYGDDPETHRVLMRKGIVIVEGLDLSQVRSGFYHLVCLPLRLVGAEAAPARAVLLAEPS